MDREFIKSIIKEMIEDGEIVVKHDLYLSKQSQDSFGEAYGAVEDVELDIYLEVVEDENS